ncbi:DUF4411 family protein [Actinomadura sp. LD22]|uniref:DUF4411 family protein n=1 Tax=Actinomadura physcomitrii TaxID=2650748 RepID=A0A6I4MRL6_9ACTN|nr:DUF4411 family protein [Actinomadura physcomitrii]MWA04936.1 DUF4411 family protein [Actinomadura physcomitrii]
MYLVDANVLIEAKNRCYAFDIAPGFWTWLDHAHANSLACSIDKVRDELLDGNDQLADWVRGRRDFFRTVDEMAMAELKPLTQWATTRQYTQAAVNTFIGDTADCYLIAYAKAHGLTVVTHEQPQPTAKKRVLIPDACVAMGVTTCDTFGMLRSTNARLHLQTPEHSSDREA